MRLLHYLPSLMTAHGGPIRAVFDLCAGICARGHSATILTQERGDAPEAWDGTSPGRPRIALLPGPLVYKQNLRGERLEIASKEVADHDAVHVHGLWDMTNIQLCHLARKACKPYFVSLRGMADDWSMAQKAVKKRIYHELFQRRQLEGAAAVHCTAQAEYDQAHKWFPKGRGVVLPNLLNLDPFRTPPGPGLAREAFPALAQATRDGRPAVLFLSRLHYKKGAEVLIDAAALLKARGVDCLTVFAGSGDPPYEASLRALVRERGVEALTMFAGHVQDALKVSLYEACTTFALPTSQENFGFVFPESLAAGTPVITTKGVDIWPELVESGGSLIVDRTPVAFADAIASVVGDPALRSRMSERGRAWVFKAFDEPTLLARYIALYESVISGVPV